MLPTIETVTQSYQGKLVQCSHINVTDAEATLRLASGQIEDGTYFFRMVAKSSAATQINVSIGNYTLPFSLTDSFADFNGTYADISAEDNPAIELIFPTGEYWLYQVSIRSPMTLNSMQDTIADLQKQLEEVRSLASEAYTNASDALPKYGVSSSAASAVAKANDGEIYGFSLYEGCKIALVFSETNTANEPTLNINGTGAKPIMTSEGIRLNSTNNAKRAWSADSLVTFVYDGANWRIEDQATLTKIDNILTNNIVGTNGWINLGQGTFNYGNKLIWDGTQLTIDGDGTFTGEITASSGTIGGFTIDATDLRAGALDAVTDGSIGFSTADFSRVINGSSRSGLRLAIGSNFGVDKTGKLYAKDADITGVVNATSGSFTGTINASSGTFTGTVNATGGSITGNLTVSGTLIGDNIEIQSTGKKGYLAIYNFGNVGCADLLVGSYGVSVSNVGIDITGPNGSIEITQTEGVYIASANSKSIDLYSSTGVNVELGSSAWFYATRGLFESALKVQGIDFTLSDTEYENLCTALGISAT